MTPDELKSTLQALGWSVAELGRQVGVSRRQATRYMSMAKLPTPVSNLLKMHLEKVKS